MTIVAFFSLLSLFTPPATMRRASMSRPLSVSSRIERRGSSMAIWKISLRFFSPPEKPSLTERLASLLSSSTIARFSRMSFRKSVAERDSSPRYLRCSFTAVRMKLTMLTPGISTGLLETEEEPFVRTVFGREGQQVLAVELDRTASHLIAGFPVSTAESVLLPEPLGPIMACTSPGFTTRSMPFNISLPLILACKSVIFNIDIWFYFFSVLLFGRSLSPMWGTAVYPTEPSSEICSSF